MGKRKPLEPLSDSPEVSQEPLESKRRTMPSRKAREMSAVLLAEQISDDEADTEVDEYVKPPSRSRKSKTLAKPEERRKPIPRASATIEKAPKTPIKKESKDTKVLTPKSAKKDTVVEVKKEIKQEEITEEANTIPPIVLPPKGKKYLGAHVSISGGLYNAILSSLQIGATSFALFLKSQRQWKSTPLTDETVTKFKKTLEKHNFPINMILPHGSYLLNCGSPNEEILEKSRNAIIDELERCERLGIMLYNFHPGSTCGNITREECISRIAESINLAHSKTKSCIMVIENMSKQGHTIGGDLKELKAIIDQVKDKKRVGICIDTCHAHAAGYDLATEDGYKSLMSDVESIIGLEYLKAIHLNDSKGEVGCHLDRHANIGKGTIGIEGFRRIMNDPRLNDIPIILETPAESDDVYEKEITVLQGLME